MTATAESRSHKTRNEKKSGTEGLLNFLCANFTITCNRGGTVMFWFLHVPTLNLLCGHWPCAHCMRYVQLCMWWSCLDNSLCHSGLCTCVHTLVSTHATNASLQYQPHAHCIAICNCSICIQSMQSGYIHICVICPWSCLRLACLQCFLQLLLAFEKIVSAGNSDWGLTWQPPVSLKLLIIFFAWEYASQKMTVEWQTES